MATRPPAVTRIHCWLWSSQARCEASPTISPAVAYAGTPSTPSALRAHALLNSSSAQSWDTAIVLQPNHRPRWTSTWRPEPILRAVCSESLRPSHPWHATNPRLDSIAAVQHGNGALAQRVVLSAQQTSRCAPRATPFAMHQLIYIAHSSPGPVSDVCCSPASQLPAMSAGRTKHAW